MKRQSYGRLALMLATTLLIVVGTSRSSRLICTGIEEFLTASTATALLLPVLDSSVVLYRAILASFLFLGAIVFPDSPALEFNGEPPAERFLLNAPDLPFRFQRPPPHLSA